MGDELIIVQTESSENKNVTGGRRVCERQLEYSRGPGYTGTGIRILICDGLGRRLGPMPLSVNCQPHFLGSESCNLENP